jgi:serine/threonine-protein kinase
MTPQQAIAHYRITGKLGEGGMGAVYRATDIKLGREVAIKVLPDAFASDPDRLARFTREAQVLASLNHPHIAAIYGVEDRALIMELVEGPTLAERIAEGPIPLEESLEIARQIGDALEAAHEKGIVHRDLKPANIKVTADGRVKVLDFGLAKALDPRAGVASDPVNSPTLTAQATEAGVILGTARYMAPEQAKGKAVDKRADIWAFGVVLYEMLTGQPLFVGETVSDTLAAVLTKEPEWERVPGKTRRLLRSCLEKEPKRRLRDIADAWRMVEEVAEAPPATAAGKIRAPWIALAAVLAVIAAAMSWIAWQATRPVEHPLTRLSVDLGPEAMTGLNLTTAISPDGRRLVFPARGPDGKQELATRLLDQAQVTLLPGTENGSAPFFSPDGQWIGFFTGDQLEKISVQGAAPVTLCATAAAPEGASWGDDGNIIAALGTLQPLSRIPTAGGPPQPLTKLGPGEVTQRWPQVLPGAGAVLFTGSSSPVAQENANVEAISLKTGQVKILQRGGYYGRYLPGGHLVYMHQGVLFGVGFDPERLEVRGEPTPLLEDVAANAASGGGQFDFSTTGTFVYVSGKSSAQVWQVEWLDSFGKMRPLFAAPGTYGVPRLSPDGRMLAFVGDGPDVYIRDLERDTTSRLTVTSHSQVPVWAPDGKHLVFQSVSNGSSFFWVRSDGAGEPQRLLESPNNAAPWSFSPDGRRLAYFESSPDTGYNLWTLPLDLTDPDHPKPGQPELFLRTPANENVPKFSPDGRWIAYRSDESGSYEIYVRPFPAGSGGKSQISAGGGLYALWSKNGRELFYETADNRIMVVDYKVEGDSFLPSKPRLWSEKQIFYTGTSNLDLAPDGKQFVVFAIPEAAGGEKSSVHVTMLLNFFDEVRRRIPAGGK